jgi:4,5-epoxidase
MRVDEVKMYVRRRLVSTMPLERMGAASGRSPLLISQAAVEDALRCRLAQLGCQAEWGHALIGAEQDGTGVTSTLRTGQGHETVRANWLIGCDGAHRTVRKLARIDFSASTADNAETAAGRARQSPGGPGTAVACRRSHRRFRLSSPSPGSR